VPEDPEVDPMTVFVRKQIFRTILFERRQPHSLVTM
jgi:hypothetical protein